MVNLLHKIIINRGIKLYGVQIVYWTKLFLVDHVLDYTY
jgi:hypothetical protein